MQLSLWGNTTTKEVWLHAPDQVSGPIAVSRGEFELAWLEMSYLCATIQKR